MISLSTGMLTLFSAENVSPEDSIKRKLPNDDNSPPKRIKLSEPVEVNEKQENEVTGTTPVKPEPYIQRNVSGTKSSEISKRKKINSILSTVGKQWNETTEKEFDLTILKEKFSLMKPEQRKLSFELFLKQLLSDPDVLKEKGLKMLFDAIQEEEFEFATVIVKRLKEIEFDFSDSRIITDFFDRNGLGLLSYVALSIFQNKFPIELFENIASEILRKPIEQRNYKDILAAQFLLDVSGVQLEGLNNFKALLPWGTLVHISYDMLASCQAHVGALLEQYLRVFNITYKPAESEEEVDPIDLLFDKFNEFYTQNENNLFVVRKAHYAKSLLLVGIEEDDTNVEKQLHDVLGNLRRDVIIRWGKLWREKMEKAHGIANSAEKYSEAAIVKYRTKYNIPTGGKVVEKQEPWTNEMDEHFIPFFKREYVQILLKRVHEQINKVSAIKELFGNWYKRNLMNWHGAKYREIETTIQVELDIILAEEIAAEYNNILKKYSSQPIKKEKRLGILFKKFGRFLKILKSHGIRYEQEDIKMIFLKSSSFDDLNLNLSTLVTKLVRIKHENDFNAKMYDQQNNIRNWVVRDILLHFKIIGVISFRANLFPSGMSSSSSSTGFIYEEVSPLLPPQAMPHVEVSPLLPPQAIPHVKVSPLLKPTPLRVAPHVLAMLPLIPI